MRARGMEILRDEHDVNDSNCSFETVSINWPVIAVGLLDSAIDVPLWKRILTSTLWREFREIQRTIKFQFYSIFLRRFIHVHYVHVQSSIFARQSDFVNDTRIA